MEYTDTWYNYYLNKYEVKSYTWKLKNAIIFQP